MLADCGELLGDTAGQAVGAFDGEPALRPLFAPGHQLPESSGGNRESATGDLAARAVDGDGGVGRLMGIDTDWGVSR